MKDPLKIEQLMKKGHLGQLLSKINVLKELNSALYNFLSPEIRPHCQIVNVDFNTAVLGTQNSQIANTLFYRQNDILAALQSAMPNANLQNLRIRVSPRL